MTIPDAVRERESEKQYQSASKQASFVIDEEGDGWVMVEMANGAVHAVKAADPDNVEAVINESFEAQFGGGVSDAEDDNEHDP